MAESIPKYLEPTLVAYEDVKATFSPSPSGTENKPEVLAGVDQFVVVALETIRTVKPVWRNKAMQRVGELGLKVFNEVLTADESELIVPPLTDGDLAALSIQRNGFTGLVESSDAKESTQATPTHKLKTDGSKSSK